MAGHGVGKVIRGQVEYTHGHSLNDEAIIENTVDVFNDVLMM